MSVELKINLASIGIVQLVMLAFKFAQTGPVARWSWPMVFLPCWAPVVLFSFFVLLLFFGWGVVLLLALYQQRKDNSREL